LSSSLSFYLSSPRFVFPRFLYLSHFSPLSISSCPSSPLVLSIPYSLSRHSSLLLSSLHTHTHTTHAHTHTPTTHTHTHTLADTHTQCVYVSLSHAVGLCV